ncbi:MAG: hypothetical protein ACFFCP_14740 [Promethearchaeota archaeon]
MEAAIKAADILKENPEYITTPTNPAIIPINERFKSRILENLKTLKKFNLITRDSIRSAYNFAFLTEESPISKTDYELLCLFSRESDVSLIDASKKLGMTPRTIARSLQRLKERHGIRFSGLLDYTAFNLQSAILFFTLREGIDWTAVEKIVTEYPFTKSILKTTMTDLGYITFLIPNITQTSQVFQRSVRDFSSEFLDYASLHYQTATGTKSNLDLLVNNNWILPASLSGDTMDLTTNTSVKSSAPLIHCGGVKEEFSQLDLAIAAEIQSDSRAGPSKIASSLQMRSIEVDPRRVALVDRKLRDNNLFLPSIYFGGLGLSSNFCFEIICNETWIKRIMTIVSQFPWAMYYLSSRGIIVWTTSPGVHQVDYYQMFRTLEQNPDVEKVHPIMTITQGGSRSMMDLTRNLIYASGRWSIDEEDVDITNYLPAIE